MWEVAHKGLFIDLDGTLADSLAALKEAYFSVLTKLGAQGSEAEFQRLNGPPLANIIEILQDTHRLPGDAAELMALYSHMIRKAHESAAPAYGAPLLLDRAQRKGWRVAVVTSSPRRSAEEWLTRNGLSKLVDVVVGGDEVTQGKPASEPYDLALALLHCIPSESLAVEDSRKGAISAVAAGLSTWVMADPSDRSGWPVEVNFIDHLTDLIEKL